MGERVGGGVGGGVQGAGGRGSRGVGSFSPCPSPPIKVRLSQTSLSNQSSLQWSDKG